MQGSPKSSKRKKQRQATARQEELERLAAKRSLTVRQQRASLRRNACLSQRQDVERERLRQHQTKVEATRSRRFQNEVSLIFCCPSDS